MGGNLRFHLYIEVEGCGGGEGEKNSTKLLDHPMNKYDKRRELCERFVDLNGLECLLGNFFDDKKDDVPMKHDVSVKGAHIPSIKSVKVVDSVAVVMMSRISQPHLSTCLALLRLIRSARVALG